MKFGGTSVGDASCIARATQIVAQAAREKAVVVVVSAMSGMTNRLVEAANRAGSGDREAGSALIAELRRQHAAALSALVSDETRRAVITSALDEIFAEGQRLLDGTALLRELTPRALDAISSLGERLCAPIFASALAELGVKTRAIAATELIVTDTFHGGAEPRMDRTRACCEATLRPLLNETCVPVVTGFIGATPDGVLTTLGRGGSDYSATILGAALDVDEVIIWTDVDGVLTGDPRLVPDARTIPEISYREAAELAYFGAKVLHPATILPAVQKSIPVWVLNSRNAENEGTKITAMAPKCASPFKSIAAKKRLTIIDIVASRMLMSHGYLKAVFDVFDKYKCAIDMVSTSEVSISLSVDSNERLPEICAELARIADVKMEGHKALVCLVGEDIRGHNGIAARVFTAVSHVNLRMISQGASEINMSFMIDEEDVEEAVRSLHGVFFADPDATVFDVDARVQLESKA